MKRAAAVTRDRSSVDPELSASPTPTSLSPEGYAKARRYLMRRDPVLGAAIKTIGPCLMAERQRSDHLSALVGSIVSQQLSTKAAATIFGRFLALFPDGHIPNGQMGAFVPAAVPGGALGVVGVRRGVKRELKSSDIP